jgi:hypothetical protein
VASGQRQRPKRMWRKESVALQATSSPRAAFSGSLGLRE